MIQIKRNNEIIITLSECPEGAIARYELMKEDYVSIKFSLAERIDLKIGDYAEIEGFKRYELVNPYSPAYNENTGGFDYDLRFDAYYYAWRNRIVRYIPNDSASETSFHLTSSVTTHLNVIINGLNGLGYNYKGEAYRYELRGYDKDLSVSKYKEYQNEDFISAMSSLAELFECEWWVEQNTIFFGKLKDNNDPVTFEVGNNVSSISAVENDGDFATRIIAFGSDRNIAATYRKNNSADVVVNGIVTKRLMLPLDKCPNGYVDRTETGSQAVEMVIVNEDIYPRVECVTSEVLTDTIKSTEEEGKEIEQVIYRLKDKSGFNFSTEYILEGQELHILFVSGKMNGMDFECIYNDEDKYYEVVINENYGRALPDENLHPEIEDKFVIYGWDSSKIADTGIIDAAEEELYNYAVDILDGMQKDKKTYNCKMFSVYSEDYEQYDAGRKVNLVSPSFGERESRIIGYEIKLDIPNDSPLYIVGEYVKYTKTETLQKQIDSIVVNGVSYKGVQSGGGVAIITSSSSLTPSDSNVFSAKMSDKRYIRRDIDDETDTTLGAKQFVAKEKVVADRIKSKTENAPVVVENDLSVEGNSSVKGDMNVKGTATFNQSVRALKEIVLGLNAEGKDKVLRSAIYEAGMKGWAVDNNGNAELESLKVRGYLETEELRINRLQGQEGDTIFTDNDKIEAVEEEVDETDGTTYYTLTLAEKWEGYFTAQQYGNICKGIVNTLAENYLAQQQGREPSVNINASGQEADAGGNKYFTSWFYVVATHNTDSRLGLNQIRVVLFGESQIPQDKNFAPCVGMSFGRWGCLNYATSDTPDYELADIKRRQSLFYISVSEGRIMRLKGVFQPILEDWMFGTTIGNLPDFVKNNESIKDRLVDNADYFYSQGVVVSDFIKIGATGAPVPVTWFCGDWVDGSTIDNPTIGNGIYLASEYNPDNRQYEVHEVRHKSGRWRCLQHQPVVINGEAVYHEPKWNSHYWRLIDGNENYNILFQSSRGMSFHRGHVDTEVTPKLMYGNVDISEDVTEQFWSWKRYTDTGETLADKAWSAQHEGVKVLHLTNEDMPQEWNSRNRAVFEVSVTIDDGKEQIIISNYIIA